MQTNPKNADGEYKPDGSFAYDYEKISRETGWSVEEIKGRGVSWCRRSPKRCPLCQNYPCTCPI